MQPLARLSPRLLFDSIASSTAPRTFRIPVRTPLRPSICLQCRIRTQSRLFADASKPPDSSKHLPSQDIRPEGEITIRPSSAEDVPTNLPSDQEGRRSALNQRFSHLMDNLQGNIFIASQRINDLTGYSGIEVLKEKIVDLETRVQEGQEAVRSSRLTYKTTVADRAATQREVTTLLARKDSWTPVDLERFTSLYRMDHSNEQAVQEAATRLADAEREAESAAGKLSSSILSRYHEEQIWSDKIRRMSTWGTWGLMGVNVLLFLVFQFGFEPWRRKRLVHGFEEKVREALEKEKEGQAFMNQTEADQVPLDGIVAAGTPHALEAESKENQDLKPDLDGTIETTIEKVKETNLGVEELHVLTAIMKLRQPETWKTAAQDLFSGRIVQVPKKEITIVAIQGAATGAAIATIIATLILRPS